MGRCVGCASGSQIVTASAAELEIERCVRHPSPQDTASITVRTLGVMQTAGISRTSKWQECGNAEWRRVSVAHTATGKTSFRHRCICVRTTGTNQFGDTTSAVGNVTEDVRGRGVFARKVTDLLRSSGCSVERLVGALGGRLCAPHFCTMMSHFAVQNFPLLELLRRLTARGTPVHVQGYRIYS